MKKLLLGLVMGFSLCATFVYGFGVYMEHVVQHMDAMQK